jgi:hypothetical protein
MGIKHAHDATQGDGSDSSLLQPSDWNADHIITGAIPGYEYTYVEFTADAAPTATTEATANTVVTAAAVSFDGSTTVLIEFFAPYASPTNTAGAYVFFVLYDGSSSIGLMGAIRTPSATGDHVVPVRLTHRLTPSNASHTYSIRAYVSSGTGEVVGGSGGTGNYVPGFIRITKV